MDDDLLNNLNNKDKLQRRNALNQLQNKFLEYEILTLELYNYYEIPLMSAVSDNSEANRYLACILIETILQKKLTPDSMIRYVIPTIRHRLCSNPVIEACEENRLEYLTLIMNMIDAYENDVHLYTNEICDILCAGLRDNYSEAILRSCDCIIKLSTVLKSRFPMFCSSFFKNLARCIHKNRLRVRVKALNTLECLYTWGNICEFDEANAVFSRCFIDVPQVRLALSAFGHSLCIHMPDRYSYWPKILPFVLFGLRDSDHEIRQKSSQFWKEIGEQYERENDIKSPFYSQTNLKTCPEEVRDLDFGVGCCMLIERNFYKMLESLVSDTKDWQEEVRLNALKILTVSNLGLKKNCLQYSKKLIDVIGYSVTDNDHRIRKESLLCAKVLGMFLPPDLYISLVEPGLWGDSDGFFLIFASLTETTPTSSLKQHSQEFLRVLYFSNIGNNISPVKQEMISKICVRLFTYCEIANFDAGWFLSLIYVLSVNPSKEKKNIEKSVVLEHVVRSFGHETVEDFISKYIETCLEMLYDDNIWFEEDDPSLCAFLYLSHFKGFHTQLDIVSKILKTKLDYMNAPLVAFAILQGLTEVFQRVCSGDQNLRKKWCSYIVNEHILKMLSYKQFRIGESLRLASVSSLLSIVTSCDENDTIYQAIEKCLEYVDGLICEDFVETRILTCRLIEVLLNKFKNFINLGRSFKFLELLMKRLDDINVKVRRVAASTLANGVRSYCLPDSTMNEEHMRKIISNVAVYFREEDTFIQTNIAGVLNEMKVTNRDIVESELRNLECEDIFKDLERLELK